MALLRHHFLPSILQHHFPPPDITFHLPSTWDSMSVFLAGTGIVIDLAHGGIGKAFKHHCYRLQNWLKCRKSTEIQTTRTSAAA